MPPSRPVDVDCVVTAGGAVVVVVVVGVRSPVTVPSSPPLPDVAGVVVGVDVGAGATVPVGAVGVGSGVVVGAGAVGALITGLPDVEPVLPVLGVPWPRSPPRRPDRRSSTGVTSGSSTGSRKVPVGGTSMSLGLPPPPPLPPPPLLPPPPDPPVPPEPPVPPPPALPVPP